MARQHEHSTGRNVELDGHKVGHADQIWGADNSFRYYLTDNSSTQIPQIGSSHKGCLIYMKDNNPDPQGYGIQYWHDLITGDIWCRNIDGADTIINEGEPSVYREWNKIANGTGMTFDEYLKKPESQGYIRNIDEPTESGFMKTGAETVAGRLPDGVDSNSKWGLVVNLFENTGNKTMFQLWFSLSGRTKGHRYTRGREGGDWTPWVDISAGGSSVPEEYFPATDADPIQNAGEFKTNGFKKTTVDTADLPPIFNTDINSRIGVLQFISENDGDDTGVQYFIPIQGKFAGTTYTRVRQNTIQTTRTGERVDATSWSSWKADSHHVKILKFEENRDFTPVEYQQNGGDTVIYEYRLTNNMGVVPSSVNKGNVALIKTIVGTDPDQHSGDGFVHQTAYFKEDDKIVTRKSLQSNGQWTPWKIVGEGGGTSIDLPRELTTMFNHWKDRIK